MAPATLAMGPTPASEAASHIRLIRGSQPSGGSYGSRVTWNRGSRPMNLWIISLDRKMEASATGTNRSSLMMVTAVSPTSKCRRIIS